MNASKARASHIAKHMHVNIDFKVTRASVKFVLRPRQKWSAVVILDQFLGGPGNIRLGDVLNPSDGFETFVHLVIV